MVGIFLCLGYGCGWYWFSFVMWCMLVWLVVLCMQGQLVVLCWCRVWVIVQIISIRLNVLVSDRLKWVMFSYRLSDCRFLYWFCCIYYFGSSDIIMLRMQVVVRMFSLDSVVVWIVLCGLFIIYIRVMFSVIRIGRCMFIRFSIVINILVFMFGQFCLVSGVSVVCSLVYMVLVCGCILCYCWKLVVVCFISMFRLLMVLWYCVVCVQVRKVMVVLL